MNTCTSRRPLPEDGKLPKAVLGVLCAVFLIATAVSVRADDDLVRLVEAKRLEVKAKEEALMRDEARLTALRKEVDEKIARYTALVARMETLLKRIEATKGERLENVVKAYEVMPAEDAATRLSALDSETALLIMTRMKSKKAGAIIAAMEPKKAAALTRDLAVITRKTAP